jgi:hypothetical protein
VLGVVGMGRMMRCWVSRMGCRVLRVLSGVGWMSRMGVRCLRMLGVLRDLLLDLDYHLEEADHEEYRADKDKEGELLYAEERHQYHARAYDDVCGSGNLAVSHL